MACIKTDKVLLPQDFQFEISPGWFLDIDVESSPIIYTHGKKSMTFHSAVVKDLCSRNDVIRLAKGRRQMILTTQVLQGLVDFETFLSWYDFHWSLNQSSAIFSGSRDLKHVYKEVHFQHFRTCHYGRHSRWSNFWHSNQRSWVTEAHLPWHQSMGMPGRMEEPDQPSLEGEERSPVDDRWE